VQPIVLDLQSSSLVKQDLQQNTGHELALYRIHHISFDMAELPVKGGACRADLM
jgi:hypothetical protein